MEKLTISYGSYTHPQGTTAYTLNREVIEDGRRIPRMEKISVSIEGKLHASTTASLEIAISNLIAAYNVRRQDFYITIDDGVTPVRSVIQVRDVDTLGGIIIKRPPSFPESRGGVGISYMPFAIALEATIPWSSSINALKSFKEKCSFWGGGPKYEFIETLVGLPQKQTTRQNRIYYATQSGTAVGFFQRPAMPDPIWPSLLMENPSYDIDGGDVWDNVTTDFQRNWTYQFQSEYPIIGEPNRWGTV